MAEFITDPGTGIAYYVDDAGDWYAPNAAGDYAPVDPPGSTTKSVWATMLADAATSLVLGYMTLQQQKAFLEENLRRARINQPLLSPQQWGSLGSVTVTADTQTRNILIAVGLGLGAVVLLGMMGGRRR